MSWALEREGGRERVGERGMGKKRDGEGERWRERERVGESELGSGRERDGE